MKLKFTFTEMVKLIEYVLVILGKIAYIRLKPSKENIKLGWGEKE